MHRTSKNTKVVNEMKAAVLATPEILEQHAAMHRQKVETRRMLEDIRERALQRNESIFNR